MVRKGSSIWLSFKWRQSILSPGSLLYMSTAKETSGPLKSGVQTVEDTVKTVVGPVSEKFRDVPFELLEFIDRKVDKSLGEFGRHVPPLVKQALGQAMTLAQKAVDAARAVASEVCSAGVMDTTANISKTVYNKYEPTARELYSKVEPLAEQYGSTVFLSFHKLLKSWSRWQLTGRRSTIRRYVQR